MATLRVGIDARGLAALKPATGLQRYQAGLIAHLAERCATDDLILYLYFGRSPLSGAYLADPRLQRGGRVRWRVAPTNRGWIRLGMGLAMLLDRLHVFHFPAPLMARFCPVPAVVTFHDLAALSLGEKHTQKERHYLPDALDAGRRAKRLVADSQSAANEVTRHLRRPDVVVIPAGVDLAQFRPASPDAVAPFRTEYGRYILCVGTLQTRKNHVRLIDAFEQIQDTVPHTLVIAGGDGSGAAEVRARAASNPRVRLVGYVPESSLPALYTGADVLALPSLWEGFGLPLIEAMACGTPVLTSSTSSLVEVADDAAIIVDPHDTGAIAAGLRDLVENASLRQRLIAAGAERARSYSWAETARRIVQIYREAAQHS